MLEIFDTHTHYENAQFDEDRETLLASMASAGVVGILNCGSDWKATQATYDLCRRLDFVYGAVGIHPSNGHDWTPEVREELVRMLDHPKVVAVGEIGLDYYWESSPPRELQREILRQQCDLALERDLPVVIHDREAHGDIMDLLREYCPKGLRGVLHCFSGSPEMAGEAVALGFHLGIGGVLTYPNARKLVTAVEEAHLESLLVETDAPYLTPHPRRGERNQSTNLVGVIERIAELKGIPPEEVARATVRNARRLLGIEEARSA